MSVLFNAIIIVLAATGAMSTGVMIASSVSSIFFCLFNYLMFMFMFGVLTTFVEWDSIRSTTRKKVRYMFTFPLFMLTYVPIALVALVKKCQWKPKMCIRDSSRAAHVLPSQRRGSIAVLDLEASFKSRGILDISRRSRPPPARPVRVTRASCSGGKAVGCLARAAGGTMGLSTDRAAAWRRRKRGAP